MANLMIKRVAVPTTETTVEKTRETMLTLRDLGVRTIEVRLDTIQELNSSNLERLFIKDLGAATLFTNRHISEAGNDTVSFGFKGNEKTRIAFLETAAANGADYVDIENAHFVQIPNAKCTIVSAHIFTGTPSSDALGVIYSRLRRREAQIVKIATTSNSWDDSLRMLRLAATASRGGGQIIALAMGDYGKITRVLAPFYGTQLTFARVGEGSAPGQMSFDELNAAMERAAAAGIPKMSEITSVELCEFAKKIKLV